MKTSQIIDPLFREALEALESGNIPVLKRLLTEHPDLVNQRLNNPESGYFKDPYLLWFVADNPIRNGKLPANIVEVTREIIAALKKQEVASINSQLDYTLGLVATGRIPNECGVQIRLMDLLIDEGATPGGGLGALANGNIAAAEHLNNPHHSEPPIRSKVSHQSAQSEPPKKGGQTVRIPGKVSHLKAVEKG